LLVLGGAQANGQSLISQVVEYGKCDKRPTTHQKRHDRDHEQTVPSTLPVYATLPMGE
jgi:hypothetical protein